MGRYRWSQRGLTDECLTLSTVELARRRVSKIGPGDVGIITWKNDQGEITSYIDFFVQLTSQNQLVLQLMYDWTDPSSRAKLPVKCPVRLTTTTSPNFGGLRYWFLCPLVTNGQPCQRRVGRLYLPAGGRYFGCRMCYNLNYRSQREHNKRIDALMKPPLDKLHWMLRSPNPFQRFEALTLLLCKLRELSKKGSKLSPKREKLWVMYFVELILITDPLRRVPRVKAGSVRRRVREKLTKRHPFRK